MTLRIATAWCREPGDDITKMPGTVEDESTLSEILIQVEQTTLTHVLDMKTQQVRTGANLSAYRLAEWLIWNWWRLRWEPAHQNVRRDQGLGWRRAHELASIGGGWLWPNIAIKSDGLRVVLDARPSPEVFTEPLRYITDQTKVVSGDAFEAGVDDLVGRVLARLGQWSLPGSTDLCTLWHELAAERSDPESVMYRKIEATRGFDVDEADPQQIEQIIADGHVLGAASMLEVAADCFLTGSELREAARTLGFDSDLGARAEPGAESWDGLGDKAPWQIGVDAAAFLRQRERLGDGPVSDHRLAELFGVEERALTDIDINGKLAYSLHNGSAAGRVVLRSKWKTGRRFEVARLFADGLVVGTDERLRPATGASTYRQKMQRAFAAELLCPIASLIDFLDDDFSDDAREGAADRFGVSPFAVTSVLANNGFVDRGEMRDPDIRAMMSQPV